ncbi:hypothetical protein [Methylocystis sp.]|uniref:hypothetical protein n=1 Tax=Methylocystis sp. TaxID=1911079 RepID=UPI003DA4DA14
MALFDSRFMAGSLVGLRRRCNEAERKKRRSDRDALDAHTIASHQRAATCGMRGQRRHSSSEELSQRRFALNWRLQALESSFICARRHFSTAIALGSSAAQNLWESRSQAARCLSIVRAVAGLNTAKPMKAEREKINSLLIGCSFV